MNGYLALAIAIVGEVVATSALKASNSFTNLVPSLVVLSGYAIAFYFLSITLKSVPVGVAYAMWGGVGIVLVTLAGFVLYQQKIDGIGIIGIGFIVVGVVLLNVFSKTSLH